MNPESLGGAVQHLEQGIYLIPGRKSGGCNVFVVKGDNKTALIDVGLPDE